MKRKLQNEFNSLENIKNYLNTKTDLDLSIVQDEWHSDGELMLTTGKQCILAKKSGSAGAKVVLLDDNIVDIKPVAPSRFINTLTQRGIIYIP